LRGEDRDVEGVVLSCVSLWGGEGVVNGTEEIGRERGTFLPITPRQAIDGIVAIALLWLYWKGGCWRLTCDG
jgi:hypothetical protein